MIDSIAEEGMLFNRRQLEYIILTIGLSNPEVTQLAEKVFILFINIVINNSNTERLEYFTWTKHQRA